MKNLFIDTNIWLSLYDFTNDDLSKFKKLKSHLGETIKLAIPKQIKYEIIRNRENKLKNSMKKFSLDLPQFPVFTKEYEQYESFKRQMDELRSNFEDWKKNIEKDIAEENLPADKTILEFFEDANYIDCEEVIDLGYKRYKIGNPPGKDNKYGDAIIWEALLKNIPNGEDLYIISADRDYRSIIDEKKINPFLEKEWNAKKKSSIKFYTNLVDFLNVHVKDIDLQAEREKLELIEKLKLSNSFMDTHGIIAMLNKYSSWSNIQIEALCESAINNSQVSLIIRDDDVKKFYTRILSDLDSDLIHNEKVIEVQNML